MITREEIESQPWFGHQREAVRELFDAYEKASVSPQVSIEDAFALAKVLGRPDLSIEDLIRLAVKTLSGR